MSEQTFQVIVNGTLTEGAQLDQVKQNIAKLFNTSVGKVEPMFSGRKMAVKKGLDQQTAQKYKAAIIKAGLAAGIAPMAPATQPQPTEQPATAGQSGVSLDNASIAAVGSVMDETPPPAEPDIDISNLDMGSPGETLSQQNQPPEPDIDVSDLTMGEVGEDDLLNDLGADSLALVTLAEAISGHYGIELVADDLVDTESVGELIKIVESRVSSKP